MIEIVSISRIIIPDNRQRKTFAPESISLLADSIEKLGNIHPPVVRKVGDDFHLVAGERRLRAITELSQLDLGYQCGTVQVPSGHIAVMEISGLDYLSAKEAELEENIIRVDLSWQERAEATRELHELKTQEALIAGNVQTVTATARLIAGADYSDVTRLQVADTLVVADHLDDPDVAKAPTQREAMKVIKKKAETKKRVALAERFEASESRHTLLLGDCLHHLATMPGESVDVILTDPPYGIGAQNFGEQSGTGHDYDDSEEYLRGVVYQAIGQFFRVAKPDSHLYLFCDPRKFPDLALECELTGWNVWPIPLIWSKLNGMLPQPDFAPRRTYECILYARKGNRKVVKVAPDVLTFSADSNLQHGAQKPVALFTELLSRSVNPGDVVLDAFAGSGTIFPAADATHCTAIGIELSIESHALCVERINALKVTL